MRKRDAKKSVKTMSPVQESFLLVVDEEKDISEQSIQEIIEKQENDQKQIDEAEQHVAKQKSKKSKLSNFLFFMLNILIVGGILIYQLTSQEVMPLSTLISSGIHFDFLVYTFILFAVYMIFESIRMNIFIKKASGRSRPYLSYKSHALGRYYDVITPLASGGQPFQILYLKGRGISASSSISITMGKYVISQLSSLFVIVIVMILIATVDLGIDTNIVSVAFYIGFALNLLISLVVLFLSVSKSLGKKMVVWILKFLKKIKIVKNYEKQYTRVIKVVNDYQTTMQDYAKSKGVFITQVFLSILIYIMNYTIPFFVSCTFLGWRPDLFLQTCVMSIMIDVAASFNPLPGGAGVSELSFTALFASLFTEGTLFWALILWRFMSYYIYIIQGFAVMAYDFFIGNKKYSWLKRKWELEAESLEFKEMKLKNYKKNKKKA